MFLDRLYYHHAVQGSLSDSFVFSAYMHTTMVGSDIFFFHTVSADGVLVILVRQAIAYLLYPLLGWLADVHFNRYKFVISSAIVMIVTSFIILCLAAFFIDHSFAKVFFFLLGGVRRSWNLHWSYLNGFI